MAEHNGHTMQENWCEPCKMGCSPPVEGLINNLCACCEKALVDRWRSREEPQAPAPAPQTYTGKDVDIARSEVFHEVQFQLSILAQSLARIGSPLAPGVEFAAVHVMVMGDAEA